MYYESDEYQAFKGGLNILDLQLEDGTLILHLRGNGGHKYYEGELIPILYCLIKKLQAKILS